MGKLVVTEFLALDGVMEAPHIWSIPYWNDEIGLFKDGEGRASEALLLGRRTYQGFAEAWPPRTGEYADRFNSQPKYVVSATLETVDWTNSHIVRPDDGLAEAIEGLKDKHSGDIVVHGSCTLAQWLLANRLVDELRLLVYPLVRGEGKKLLDNLGEIPLTLKESRSVGSDVNLLIYQPAMSW